VSSIFQPLLFPGQYQDLETFTLDDYTIFDKPALALNTRRTYDPFTGGYVQLDPMQENTRSGYVYADSNPVGSSDSTGLQKNDGRFYRSSASRTICGEVNPSLDSSDLVPGFGPNYDIGQPWNQGVIAGKDTYGSTGGVYNRPRTGGQLAGTWDTDYDIDCNDRTPAGPSSGNGSSIQLTWTYPGDSTGPDEGCFPAPQFDEQRCDVCVYHCAAANGDLSCLDGNCSFDQLQTMNACKVAECESILNPVCDTICGMSSFTFSIFASTSTQAQ